MRLAGQLTTDFAVFILTEVWYDIKYCFVSSFYLICGGLATIIPGSSFPAGRQSRYKVEDCRSLSIPQAGDRRDVMHSKITST
jgi:hypothetical protein